MARLIDADALKKAIMAEPWKNEPNMVRLTVDYINIIIDEQPTVDAVPVVHGRWIRKPIGKYTGAYDVCCSICDFFIGVVCSDAGFREAIEDLNCCPSCGAHMDLEV